MKKKFLIRIEKNLHDYAKYVLAPIVVGEKDFSKVVEALIYLKKQEREQKEMMYTFSFDLKDYVPDERINLK